MTAHTLQNQVVLTLQLGQVVQLDGGQRMGSFFVQFVVKSYDFVLVLARLLQVLHLHSEIHGSLEYVFNRFAGVLRCRFLVRVVFPNCFKQ